VMKGGLVRWGGCGGGGGEGWGEGLLSHINCCL